MITASHCTRAGWSTAGPPGRGNGATVAQEQCKNTYQNGRLMSWEYRGNQRYYYRKTKIGGQIQTEYIGGGQVAEFIAKQDEHDRQRREMEAAECQALLADERETVEMLAEVDDLLRTLTTGVMLANGFHTHRRQWRKMSQNVRKDVP